MAVFKKIFKKFLGFEEDNIDRDDENFQSFTEDNNGIERQNNHNNRERLDNIKDVYQENLNLNSMNHSKEIIMYPKSFADACDVVEKLELGYAVIVDMDDLEIDICKRITDFVLGAIFVLEGDVEKVSKKVFRFWTVR